MNGRRRAGVSFGIALGRGYTSKPEVQEAVVGATGGEHVLVRKVPRLNAAKESQCVVRERETKPQFAARQLSLEDEEGLNSCSRRVR